MITNYHTLEALVREWEAYVVGHELGDVFSQEPDELTLAFTSKEDESMIRVGTRAPLRFIFRSDGYSKARRNVATLFERAIGRTVSELTIAHRDRMIFVTLDDDRTIQIMLFGPRANVLLLSPEGFVEEAFRDGSNLVDTEPPGPRSAPTVESFDDFKSRWHTNRKSVAHATASAFPLFDREIATEAAHRAGIDPDRSPELGPSNLRALFDAARTVENELNHPTPRIYWEDKDPVQFSLIELGHLANYQAEEFDSVDEADRVFVRRSLARRRFRALYDPIGKALTDALAHYENSAEKMLEELSNESRADQYEKWGHLLMASPQHVPPGAEEVELPDLFSDAKSARIPLDPARSAVANARRYYERAKRTRRSREEAEKRLVETEKMANDAANLLAELRDVSHVRDLQEFRKAREDALARFMPDEKAPGERVPFRRFALPGGYEVWVGRNASQNDDLTFHHAQKYDLWMHARGVPGSHAVLRKPNRDADPSKHVLHRAASIAAHFSKARGSSLVPVIVTERKYVTKPKGAPPGAVRIDREDVILVEPGLPS